MATTLYVRMSVVMPSISHSMYYMCRKAMGLLTSSTFTVQNSFVPDKDVPGRNVVLLQSTVHF